MKYLVLGFVLAGCAHTSTVRCPDGTQVEVAQSESENTYLAYASEQNRGLAQCARLKAQESLGAAEE